MKFSLRRLVKLFTVLCSIIIILAAIFYINAEKNNFYTEQEQLQNNIFGRVSDEIQKDDLITNNIAHFLSEDETRISNIEEYLKNDPPKYAKYVLKQKQYFNWPNTSKSLYIQYPQLKELQIRFMNNNYIYTSSNFNTTGRIVKDSTNKNTQNMFYSSITNPRLEEVVGIVATKFNASPLRRSISELSGNKHVQVLVLGTNGGIIFHFADASVTKPEKSQVKNEVNKRKYKNITGYTVKVRNNVSDEYKILVITKDSVTSKLLRERIFMVILVASIVLLALFISFVATFHNYRKELKSIITTTELVSKNNLNARINTRNHRFTDLNLLSHSINTMLDEINNYINTIYKIRIAQQDAHMKSLQAQISPHFMANTLEYIRMSALDIGARDLAKVVFSFASLLRSNVGNQVQSTIKAEIKLVKNYIFLYQVRFPDKLAYQINVDSKLDNVKIPKFTLQPIIENYFAHGVNFANGNNAVEVKGWLENGQVNIWVIDNGKHIDVEELSKLNLHLQEPIVGDKSIGLQNVYARMSNYTHNFKMMIINNRYGGITVKLSFDFES